MSLPLGIQLYTVRDRLDDNFRDTLRALAEMGYQGVEFAGKYGGMSPEDFGRFLKEINLACCGFHANVKMISDPSSDLYAYARACGGHFVSPSMANRVDDWAAAIEDAKTAAKVAADQGMQFTYHNHAQEFQRIDGQYALDMLYERTDPAAVQAELDVYWIRKGGADPVAYIRKYVGRVPQVHLKDMDPSDESFAEIGAGCLDIKGICEAAAEARTDWIIVEQDTCKQPSIDAARQSVEFLKEAGLA